MGTHEKLILMSLQRQRFQQPDCCLNRDINQTFDFNQMQTKRERRFTDERKANEEKESVGSSANKA